MPIHRPCFLLNYNCLRQLHYFFFNEIFHKIFVALKRAFCVKTISAAAYSNISVNCSEIIFRLPRRKSNDSGHLGIPPSSAVSEWIDQSSFVFCWSCPDNPRGVWAVFQCCRSGCEGYPRHQVDSTTCTPGSNRWVWIWSMTDQLLLAGGSRACPARWSPDLEVSVEPQLLQNRGHAESSASSCWHALS